LAKAEPQRFRTINANQPPASVSDEIWNAVSDHF